MAATGETNALLGSNAGESKPASWLCAGGMLLALGAVFGSVGMLGSQMMMGGLRGSALGPPGVGAPEALNPSGEMACGAPGSFDFLPVSSIDPSSKEAIAHALLMLGIQRQDCPGGAMPKLPFTASMFEHGGNHSCSAKLQHKFDTNCEGEAFKINFFLPGSDNSPKSELSFVAEAYHGFAGKSWRLLTVRPTPCEIATGVPAAPEMLSPADKYVKESTTFALNELGYNMKKQGCLDQGGHLALKRIREARSSVAAGMRISLLLSVGIVSGAGAEGAPHSVELVVEDKCDGFEKGGCVRELFIPGTEGGMPCTALQPEGPENRRLSERFHFGHIRPDATAELLSRRATLRQLGSSTRRMGMQRRQITSGDIVAQYDPRGHDCYKVIPLYDQGSCGSCYAQAVAQMIGIRKCHQDKGMPVQGRRLQTSPPVLKEKAANGATANAPAGSHMFSASGSDAGCQDDASFKDPSSDGCAWFAANDPGCKTYKDYGQKSSCKKTCGTCPAPDSGNGGCKDSTLWADNSGDSCGWYTTNDAGCKKYKDYGQKTHCQKTCGTCASVVDQKSDSNPWNKADYKYLPDPGTLGECANQPATPPGCDGGNTQIIWEKFMKGRSEDLWSRGAQCQPYNLKCWSDTSGGVVNPLTGGQCGEYAGYQLWHKPCSCIPKSERPTKYTCRSAQPQAGCEIPVPYAMFTVMNMEHGLSNAEAVKNMQRHIAEYGPIYMSFSTPSSFQSWDWNKNPVFTGTGDSRGGHAIIGIGWGSTSSGLNYWQLRNSWGDRWADGGYFKWQRGANLNGIEASETTAAMPVANFKDFSAPYCDIDNTNVLWSFSGSKLAGFTMKLTVSCNKKSKLKIFVSNRIQKEEDVQQGVSGTYINKEYPADTTSIVVEADLLCRKFGLVGGMTWVSIEATDAAGNVGNFDHFLPVSAVQGMTTSAGCQSR